MNAHTCIKITPRPTDYIKGINSPITFKAISNGNWLPRIDFYEAQKLQFETDGCVLFTAQESFDAQMDQLILNGAIPSYALTWMQNNGYFDTGLDGKQHFHSSPRFLQDLTGNGFNGNALTDSWDVMRKFGVLPWKDLPFDETITQAEYLAPIPQPLLTKAAQFLSLIGGKNAIQYHWVLNDAPHNTAKLISALPQAPLCLGINLDSNWNVVQPPNVDGSPVHSIMNYCVDTFIEIYDHYHPEKKQLALDYPVHFALQGIISPSFTPPTLPPNPTTPQISSWLDQLKAWLSSILIAIKGRSNISSISMNYSLFRSRTFYTLLAGFLVNVYQLAAPSLPPVATGILDTVVLVLASYFHLQTGQSTTGTN